MVVFCWAAAEVVIIDLGNVVFAHGELLKLYRHLDLEVFFLVRLGTGTPLADLKGDVGMVSARAGRFCHVIDAIGRAIASQAPQGLERDLLLDTLWVGAHRLLREVLTLPSHLRVAINIAELLASHCTISVQRYLPLMSERVQTPTVTVSTLHSLSSLVDLGDSELIVAQNEQILLVFRTAYLHQLMHIRGVTASRYPIT